MEIKIALNNEIHFDTSSLRSRLQFSCDYLLDMPCGSIQSSKDNECRYWDNESPEQLIARVKEKTHGYAKDHILNCTRCIAILLKNDKANPSRSET